MHCWQPVSSDEEIELPSGDETRIRSEDSVFDETTGTAQWNVTVEQEGTYTIFVYAKLQEILTNGDIVYVYTTVNGIETESILYPSAYYQPVSFQQELNKGENTIKVSFDALGGEICFDKIEIMRCK